MQMLSSPLLSSRPRRYVVELLCLATVWTFTAGATSCSTSDFAGPTFVTDLALKTDGGAVTEEFAPAEPITFELSVRNRTRTPTVLQFSSGHQFDFVVLDRGTNRIRWKWSRRRAFTQATTEIEFAAEETRTFRVTWDQIDDSGQQLSPGNYEARGVLLFPEFEADPLAPNQLGSSLRPLTIR